VATANQQYAYQYFTSNGWSPNAAQAMVATLSGESGSNLNTSTLQGSDASFGGGNGIANWSPTRWNAIGKPSTFDGQLAAVNQEAGQYGIDKTSNADPQQLTIDYTRHYENPKVANGAERWNNFDPSNLSEGDGTQIATTSVGGQAVDPSSGTAFSGTPLSALGMGGGSNSANLAGSSLSGGGANTPLDTSTGPALPDVSMGIPLYITDPSSVGAIAGARVQAGANTINTGLQKDTAALTSNLTQDVKTSTTAGTSWLQSIQNTIFDTFPRIFTGLGALILIGMGIWLIGKEGKKA
jgi:Phage tail lysozyme